VGADWVTQVVTSIVAAQARKGVAVRAAALVVSFLLLAEASTVLWQWPVGLVKMATLSQAEYTIDEIRPGSEVEQTFVATADRLCQVDVRLANYGRRIDVDVYFVLRDGSSGRDLVSKRFRGRDVDGGTYHQFTFPCQEHSRGRTYILILESPQAGSMRAISALASSVDLYPQGVLTQGGRKLPGDLLFRLGYRSTVGDVIRMGFDSVSRVQVGPIDGRAAFLAMGFLYLLSGFLALNLATAAVWKSSLGPQHMKAPRENDDSIRLD